jgi:hypothetical protein
MNPLDESASERLAFLRMLTLLATLTTAGEVRHAIRERRDGRDPSQQEEPKVVIPLLLQVGEELAALLLQIRASLVIAVVEGDGVVVAPTRHMLRVLRLNQVVHLLHRIHQRLLSLYPDVSEDLIEEGRLLHSESRAYIQDETDAGYEEQVELIDRLLDFTVRMERSVRVH